MTGDVEPELVAFVFREARYADESRYDEWESLWHDRDALYWVPMHEGADPAREVSYIYDNRPRIAKLYGGSLDDNAIRATLTYGKPHEQAVAIAVLGEARDASALAILAPQLAHAYPLVRYYAAHALQLITGDRIDLDLGRPYAELTQAAAAWLDARR